MTECFSPGVRDFLPDFVHGRLGDIDAATLAAHVEACGACAREVALLGEVRQTAPLAPPIDIDSIVARLPVAAVGPAVVAPSRVGVSLGGPVMWKVFALIGIMVTGGVVANRVSLQPDTVVTSAAPPVGVPLTQAPGTPTVRGSSLSLIGGVRDLTDDQIETLLAEIDDVEAMPSLEPEPAVIPAVDTEPVP